MLLHCFVCERFFLWCVIPAYNLFFIFVRFFLIYTYSSIPFSIQFAVNHEIEDAAKHELDSYRGDWGAHQVRTSYDYAPTSWFWVHFSGGVFSPSLSFTFFFLLEILIDWILVTFHFFRRDFFEDLILFVFLVRHGNRQV